MELSYDSFQKEYQVLLKGEMTHRVPIGTSAAGNIQRLDNALAGIPARLEKAEQQLDNLRSQQEAAQAELGKPFPQEAELAEKSARLAELDALLNMDDREMMIQTVREQRKSRLSWQSCVTVQGAFRR